MRNRYAPRIRSSGVVPDPVLVGELLEARERGLGALIRAFASSRSAETSSGRRSARISSGSVRPCPTSVTRMTTNVRNTIRSRPGTSIGSASAAASETAPRIPAHEMTTGACHGGYGSRSRTLRKRKRGTYVKIGTQTIRSTITARVT